MNLQHGLLVIAYLYLLRKIPPIVVLLATSANPFDTLVNSPAFYSIHFLNFI